MDEQPNVSVVVPCYNVERYVEECLRSIMGQTLHNIEIICVNDGSTDSTLEVLQRLANEDSRISIIDKPNTGYGNTMNIGFAAAKGEYIGIVESDDYVEPNMMEVLYGLAKEHDLDVSKSEFFFYYTKPEVSNRLSFEYWHDNHGKLFHPDEENFFVFTCRPCIWSAIYRASFIREKNVMFNETPGASYQDASFNFEVWLKAQRCWWVREGLIHYRQDNEQSSVNSPGKVFCVCDEYVRIYSLVDELEDKDRARRLRLMLSPRKYSSYKWNYERLSPELGLEFLKRVQQEYLEHEKRGEIDWSLFRPEWEAALKSIMADPFLYHMDYTEDSDQSSALRTLKRYYKAGGLGGVVKLIRRKLGH